MKKKNSKGQSTLEYIILVTAIVAVAIVFLKPAPGGKLFDAVEITQNEAADGIHLRGGVLTNSWNAWNND